MQSIKKINAKFIKSNHTYHVDKKYKNLPIFTASSVGKQFIDSQINSTMPLLVKCYGDVASRLGTGTHEALEELLTYIKVNKVGSYNTVRHIVDKYKEQNKLFYNLGSLVLDNYTPFQLINAEIECKIAVLVNEKFILCGKFDVLLPHLNGNILIDFKTTVLKDLKPESLGGLAETAKKVILDDKFNMLNNDSESMRKITLFTIYLLQMSVYWLGLTTAQPNKRCDCHILWSANHITRVSHDELKTYSDILLKKIDETL